ncbi:MAG: amino acid permease, partial [Planctomycetota bacterium]|nr:amino acid permease [Planctomycetota bacterium]
SIVELSTAMPKAGGAYYFLDRALGPLFGTVGGFGTWLALVLKTSFALVGIGAYATIFFPDASPLVMKLVAAGFAVAFGLLNALGAGKTGSYQAILVFGLLAILAIFMAVGAASVDLSNFRGFFDSGTESILATTGMVYISYVGVTKVASISEEVRDPERNLPLGVFLSLAVALLVYGLCTTVMVGVLPMEELTQSTVPMADAAFAMFGTWGLYVVAGGAFLAFFAVSNAGIMASSRYPMAMSRDQLVPAGLAKVSARGTPVRSIVLTVAVIVAVVILLDPVKIAKLASAFQLLVFALLCIAVVVMRESGLDSYDPGYKAPFYPWLQVVGVLAPMVLIAQMGLISTLFSAALILVGVIWYVYYAHKRVERTGAIFHVFARLGEQRRDELDSELRSILKDKGLRDQDPFEEAVLASEVIDVEGIISFEELITEAAKRLAPRVHQDRETLIKGFTEGTLKGATPVAKGVALPHMRLENIEDSHMVLVRLRREIRFVTGDVFGTTNETDPIHAVFFLVSPESDPGQHLRMLAQLATRIDEDAFHEQWLAASNEVRLREVFLRDERYVSLRLTPDHRAFQLAGKRIADLDLPEECLVAAVRREGRTLVPHGSTQLARGDRILIIGEPEAISLLYARFLPGDGESKSIA